MSDQTKFNGSRLRSSLRIMGLAIVAGVAAVVLLGRYASGPKPQSMLAAEFQRRMEANPAQFVEVIYQYNQQTPPIGELVGSYYPTDAAGHLLTNKEPVKFQTQVLLSDAMQEQLQRLPNFKIHQPGSLWASVLLYLVPLVVLAALVAGVGILIFLLFRLANRPRT